MRVYHSVANFVLAKKIGGSGVTIEMVMVETAVTFEMPLSALLGLLHSRELGLQPVVNVDDADMGIH
jgi:hypothetical protein